MNRTMPAACRAYGLAVGTLGMLPLGWAVWTLIAHPPHPAWYLLAPLAILSGPLCIRIPSMQATISVSEGFIFTSALLFGPPAATAIAAIDGLAVSLWSSRRSPIKMLFGVGEPAISVCLASLLFYELAGVPPLLHSPTAVTPLILPLLALTGTYFALNTVLAGTAVWLDTGGAPSTLLRHHLPNLALDFAVSLALAAALVQTSGNLTLAALVVLLPVLLSSYVSSHHVAGRLEDTNRHLSELRRLYDSTVETLAMAIDAKDQVTHGHIRRVQHLSTELARALGAAPGDVQALEAAALLHDLGKLAVPEHILNKPGPLSAAEYEAIKKHADIGASLLSAIEFPFPVVPIVRHHHESWDGTGYPDGLAGEAIPLGARILAVVDCYDALTSDRPYRRRMPHADALAIIGSRSGRMYDPSVVEAFVRLAADTPDYGVDLQPLPSLRRADTSIVEPAAPVFRSAASPSKRDPSYGIAQFLATLGGMSWDDAGRAIATFIPKTLPDCVAVLFRFEHDTHDLRAAGMHRGSDPRIPDRMAVGQGVTGWVAANRRMMANVDAELDLGDVARLIQPPLRLCVSVPVLDRGETAAVLTVYSAYAFSEIDRMVIELLAGDLPLALSRGADAPADAVK